MAETNLTTFIYQADSAKRLLADIANNNYYFFTCDHTVSVNSSSVANVETDNFNIVYETYRNMIAGKKISANSADLSIRNIPYQSGKVFDMYDDKDQELNTKDFYTVVNASSQYHVFKCLDNNLGANSTIEPNFADIVGANTNLYQTSDGYRWKYMYSFDSAHNLKFSTSNTVPIVVNTSVIDIAVSGSIDIIRVIDTGRGYHNYITGAFKNTDIVIDGDTHVYAISNSVAKSVNGFYTGCMLYITSGAGAGQYRSITDYISDADGNFIVLDTELDVVPVNGTQYEIYPSVIVTGSGTETINVSARALVNSLSSNSIYRVEVLERGANYTYVTANVVANDSVGVLTQATVRAILPPGGGHGYDPITEMQCHNVTISMTLANSESNTIPSTNFYRRVGILKNPQFHDVVLNLNDSTGTFLPGETVYKITTIHVQTDLSINASSTSVVGSNTENFNEKLSAGQTIILKTPDNTSYQFLTVNNVINTTAFNTTSNVFFTSSNAVLYLAEVQANAVVTSTVSGSQIVVTNCCPSFIANSIIIGLSSGTHAIIANTVRSGVSKDFSTFIQLNKYTGTLSFGSFEQNEAVTQGNTAAALVHSVSTNSGILTMYTSNQVGSFATMNNIVGSLSTAIMSVSAKYNPEVVFGSGTPLYIENLSPITRLDTQSEVFKIVLDF